MRYIDIIRTILRNASEKDIPALTWDEQRTHLNKIRKRIDDVEIVVRCKDCRHRDLFSCPLADNDFQKDDDYCSWGERR